MSIVSEFFKPIFPRKDTGTKEKVAEQLEDPNAPPPINSGSGQADIDAIIKELGRYRDLIEGSLGEFEGDFGYFDPSRQQKQLGGISESLIGEGGITGQLGALGEQFRGISSGAEDPAFEAYRQAQLGLLAGQEQQQRGAASEFFQRRGLTGSAELDRLASIESQFGQQARGLSSQIGLQSLQRREQARQGLAGVLGQQTGVYGQAAGLQQGIAGLGFQSQEQKNLAEQSRIEALVARLETAGIPSELLLQLFGTKVAGGDPYKDVDIGFQPRQPLPHTIGPQKPGGETRYGRPAEENPEGYRIR
jgi:hypothetical protein